MNIAPVALKLFGGGAGLAAQQRHSPEHDQLEHRQDSLGTGTTRDSV
jgi:hypothetical protein